MKTISVLGCGWLGFPLAISLVEKQLKVNGSTTSQSKLEILESKNINPYLLSFEPLFEGNEEFFDADILIINIPPRARKMGENFHLEQIKEVCKAISIKQSLKSIIFVSSTSVYDAKNIEVYERDATLEHFLVKAELILTGFCRQNNLNLTVLRCGGLMGYDRIPCKYFSGKKEIDTGHVPVNYIHRDDVIGVINHIISNDFWGEILNVVSPMHPTKKELLETNCPENNFELPAFSETKSNTPYKIVSSQKLMDKIGYKFIFPDPLFFKYLN